MMFTPENRGGERDQKVINVITSSVYYMTAGDLQIGVDANENKLDVYLIYKDNSMLYYNLDSIWISVIKDNDIYILSARMWR